MTDVAIGMRPHTGWAVLVSVAVEDGQPVVVDRRRLELFADDERFAYHAAAEVAPTLEEGVALIDRVRKESHRAARAGVKEVVKAVGTAGHKAVAVGLPPARTLPPVEKILGSHPLLHTAEGELYREALADGANRCHLRMSVAPVKDLLPHAAGVLDEEVASLTHLLAALGKSLGSPWTKDHREAALLAWLALVGPASASIET